MPDPDKHIKEHTVEQYVNGQIVGEVTTEPRSRTYKGKEQASCRITATVPKTKTTRYHSAWVKAESDSDAGQAILSLEKGDIAYVEGEWWLGTWKSDTGIRPTITIYADIVERR